MQQSVVGPEEGVKIRGSFHMVVLDPQGRVREERQVNNLVVSAGKAIVAGLINSAVTATSTGGATFRYLAIGASSSAAAIGDTTLGSEFSSAGGARAIAAATRTTTTVTNDTAQLVLTYTCSAGGLAVVEAGIFDSSSGGNMLARQPFAVINLSSGDSLQTTWKVQVS